MSRPASHSGYLRCVRSSPWDRFAVAVAICLVVASARFAARARDLQFLDSALGFGSHVACGCSIVAMIRLLALPRRSFAMSWTAGLVAILLLLFVEGAFIQRNDVFEAIRSLAAMLMLPAATMLGVRLADTGGRGTVNAISTLSLGAGVLTIVGVLELSGRGDELAVGKRLAGADTSINAVAELFVGPSTAIFFVAAMPPSAQVGNPIAWMACLLGAVLCQTRLGVGYLLASAAVAAGCSGRSRLTSAANASARRVGTFALAALLIAVPVAVKSPIAAQLNSLLDRVRMGVRDGDDVPGDTRFEITYSRWGIFGECWEDLSSTERIFGRGLGASFRWERPINEAPTEGALLERQEALWIAEHEYFGRRAMEVGWGNLLLQGGVVLAAWIFIGFLWAISQGWRSGLPHGRAIAAVLILVVIYDMWGGDFVTTSLPKLFVEGLLIGWGCALRHVRKGRLTSPEQVPSACRRVRTGGISVAGT